MSNMLKTMAEKNFVVSPAVNYPRSPLRSDEECKYTFEKKCEEEEKKRMDPSYIVPTVEKKTFAARGLFEFAGVMANDEVLLRTLVNAIFPFGTYKDDFYTEVLQSPYPLLHRFACFNGVVVGVVSCKVEQISNGRLMKIRMIGVLPAYRKCGFGEELYQYARNLCRVNRSIKKICTYAQVNNDGAIKFFEKRGFEIKGEPIDDVYSTEPKDAYLLMKVLGNPI
uniref:N-terminal methionine N(alpha)-acetyltransferase NatE n=1 Tax=Caenorhabditis tropicalis TaxID=1561998 RepID=A0A1I7TL97_9PELO